MEEQREIELELKSEQMNEMLSDPPAWITRSGNGVFLLVILILVILTWFIRYPDEINGEVVVTTSGAPIELSNQTYIQFKSLNVRENQIVEKGELIAQFDILAKSEDIDKANEYLYKLERLGNSFQKKIPEFNQRLQLGTFQEQWTTLLSKIHEWNTEHIENILGKELKFIRQEISFREQLQTISAKKVKLSEDESKLIDEQLAGTEWLVEQNALSKQVFSQEKHSQNQVMQSVQSQKEQYVQNLITLNALRKEQLRLEHDARLEEIQKTAEIQISLVTLRTGFQNWKRNSVWVAPCAGKVVFNKILQVNRFYKTNEASIVIVPGGAGYQGIAAVNSIGAGKLNNGQKAFIELLDYPKAEFGMLEGKVTAITKIDKNGKYEVSINLLNQLKTTYGIEIPPKAQLKGKVKIITKNKRLLARFFEQLTDLIK